MTPKWEPGQDEYLETMARLLEEKRGSSVTILAKELGVAKASVSQMLRRIAVAGLVSFPKYGEPVLTKKGILMGVAILKKHRTLHGFLALIGLRKSKIHCEACRLEHAVSDEVERRMSLFVENVRKQSGFITLR